MVKIFKMRSSADSDKDIMEKFNKTFFNIWNRIQDLHTEAFRNYPENFERVKEEHGKELIAYKVKIEVLFSEIDIKEQSNQLYYWVLTRDAHTRAFVLTPYSRTLRTEYERCGVQRASCWRSTNFGTGYGNFFITKYLVTESTEYNEYFCQDVPT